MATFTTAPDFNSPLSVEPRVLTAQFGDGYQQRVGDGINIAPRSWALTFNNRTVTEKNTIEAFLLARNGLEAFDWTPPTGAAGKWICKAWQATPNNAAMWSVTATFTEVFEP